MSKAKIELNPSRNHGLQDYSYLSQGDYSAQKEVQGILPKEANESFRLGVAAATIFWVKTAPGWTDTYRESIACALVNLCLEPPPTSKVPTWEEMESEGYAYREPQVQKLFDRCIQKIKQELRNKSNTTITVDLEKDTPSDVYNEVMKRLEEKVHCSVKYRQGQTDIRDNYTESDWLEISPPPKSK